MQLPATDDVLVLSWKTLRFVLKSKVLVTAKVRVLKVTVLLEYIIK